MNHIGTARTALIAIAMAFTTITPVIAQFQVAPDSTTPRVFRRYADYVVKVQVVETGSGAKAGLGSGFFVTADGHIVTNYHVVSDVINNPERYRAELADGVGAGTALEILAVDVVHDLAVARAPVANPHHFELSATLPAQGTRLYALGHPSDLGLTIVEGTFNGLLRHTLYPKIHFTGSINPGMSGGPTMTEGGRVVGINVSTAGNQLSFLVPVDRAIALLATALAPGRPAPSSFRTEVRDQIRAYQDAYLEGLFTESANTVDLGRFRVVTQPAPFFRCWGDAQRSEDEPYETVEHSCSTDDQLYIADDQRSGVVKVVHQHITSSTLQAPRFYTLYSQLFSRDDTPFGVEEHVTPWKCTTRNVRNGATPLRSVLCLRAYRKLEGLYDAVLKVAVLGDRRAGLVSTLTLSGVSFENVSRLSERYLERITWR